jgi:hypothetical protein
MPALWPQLVGRKVTSASVCSTVLESRLALLDEGGHALLLVLQRELRLEHAPLEEHPLGERGLVGAVDRFLDQAV